MSKRALLVPLACILVSGCELLVSLPGSDGVVPTTDAGSEARDVAADVAPGADGACDGSCAARPTSCATPGLGRSTGCGPNHDESCCPSDRVPDGYFFRANRTNDNSAGAHIASYFLDRYEVTVGRFRQFIDGGFGSLDRVPAAGYGASDRTPNSGWQDTFNSRLERGQQYLFNQLTCVRHDVDCVGPAWTWTPQPAANEALPIVDVPWVIAFWFCAWDGGRLPTEAEWELAALGGDQQRGYPWGDPTPDDTRAAFGCTFGELDASPSPTCTVANYRAPGSFPDGRGRWGHADLAGNAAEWVLDTYRDSYDTGCQDCAFTQVDAELYTKVYRGGSIGSVKAELSNADRRQAPLGYTRDGVGFRCARDH